MTGNCDVMDPGSSQSSSATTIDICKYVAQLEERVLEQASFIRLLQEKVASLEKASADTQIHLSGNKKSYAKTLQTPATAAASTSASSDVITGSRKSEKIAAVPNTRHASFFVTRISPSVSAAVLAQDLLSYAVDLESVVCSKMKTRHTSYSSFHLSIPEDQKDLINCNDAWPEGVLVKPFTGKLLKNYILESYDSLDPDGKSSSKKIGSVSTTGNGITKSSDDKPKATASKQSSTGSGVKTPVLPKAASNPTSSPKNVTRARTTRKT
ncbi:hypothetical protein M8J77_023787 [Diaphorina citri]|nr:hypothetical protein M8J77_023787 [Diaphorina citri]